jgi:hypothetical protein
MSIQQFLIYLIVIGGAYAAYCSHRAKSKIYASFVKRDRTKGHKWVKAKNGERIEYENGWYYVVMKCVTTEPLDTGFNMLFPTMVRQLDFTYKSKYPIDHDTGEPLAETPEMRKNLNKREDIESLNQGTRQAFGKGAKVGLLGGGLLPVLLIVGVVISLYFIWQLMGAVNNLGFAMNVIQNMLIKIVPK